VAISKYLNRKDLDIKILIPLHLAAENPLKSTPIRDGVRKILL
jgi:hypothetical protein